jgi:hypothetical protein
MTVSRGLAKQKTRRRKVMSFRFQVSISNTVQEMLKLGFFGRAIKSRGNQLLGFR